MEMASTVSLPGCDTGHRDRTLGRINSCIYGWVATGDAKTGPRLTFGLAEPAKDRSGRRKPEPRVSARGLGVVRAGPQLLPEVGWLAVVGWRAGRPEQRGRALPAADGRRLVLLPRAVERRRRPLQAEHGAELVRPAEQPAGSA